MRLTGNLRYFKKTMSKYQFGHCKSLVDCPGAELSFHNKKLATDH
jgi:hypothetical protein